MLKNNRVGRLISSLVVAFAFWLPFAFAEAPAQTAGSCLFYAGMPHDPTLYPGVDLDQIELEKARPACQTEARTPTPDPRVLTALARIALIEGREDEALSLAKTAIKSGDKFAYGILAYHTLYFDFGNQNYVATALKYLNNFEDIGSPSANNVLASYLLSNSPDRKSLQKALDLSISAFKQGLYTALFNLAKLNAAGTLSNEELAAYLSQVEQAAKEGIPLAQIVMGEVLFVGIGRSIDEKAAVSWMKRAADAGDPWAAQIMGRLHRIGLGTPIDAERALYWYREAIKRKKFTASKGLAIVLEQLGRAEPAEVDRLLQEAAVRGDSEALIVLGFRLLNREAPMRNQGERYVQQGARSANNAASFYDLAEFFKKQENYAKAAKYYLEAGRLGSVDGEIGIAKLEMSSKINNPLGNGGVSRIRKAAEAGNSLAQRWMGLLLSHQIEEYTGIIEQSVDEADRWFNKASSQGDQYSMYYVGSQNFSNASNDKEKLDSLGILKKIADTGDSLYVSTYFESLFTSGMPHEIQSGLSWGFKKYKAGEAEFGPHVGEGYLTFGIDEASQLIGRKISLKIAKKSPDMAVKIAGWMAKNEYGFEWSGDQALRLLALHPDDKWARTNLGYYLLYAPNVAPRPQEAFKNLKYAADQGYSYACYIGLEVFGNFELQIEPSEAKRLLDCAAEQDRAGANFLYAAGVHRNFNTLDRFELISRHYKEAIELYLEKLKKPDNNKEEKKEIAGYLSTALSVVGAISSMSGRYDESEEIFRDALRISEEVGLPPEMRMMIISSFASALEQAGQLNRSQKLFETILPAREQWADLSPSPLSDLVFYSYGLLAERLGEFDKAEQIFVRLAKVYSEDKSDMAAIAVGSKSILARIKTRNGDYSEAGELYREVMPQVRSEFSNTPVEIRYVADYAVYLVKTHDYKRAISLFEQMRLKLKLAGLEDHPQVFEVLGYYISALVRTGNESRALTTSEQLLKTFANRISRQARGSHTGYRYERVIIAAAVKDLIETLQGADFRSPNMSERANELSFQLAQVARSLSSSEAMTKMAAASSEQSDALRPVFRRRQGLMSKLEKIDSELTPKTTAQIDILKLIGSRQEIETELAKLDGEISSTAPEYFEQTSATPKTTGELQAHLNPGEAVLILLSQENSTHAWLVKGGENHYEKLKVGSTEIGKTVSELRSDLDLSNSSSLSDVKPFNVEKAHNLYQQILGPFERLLANVDHLILVADGGLQSLPLGVLVTGTFAQPEANDYRNVPWLTKRYAITIIPSVSSFYAIRKFAGKSEARVAFKGIGDPSLNGNYNELIQLTAADLRTRSGLANINELKKLPNLPETRDELRFLANKFGVGDDDLFTGENATETRVKNGALSEARVVAFATHGLVSGEMRDLNEPALVLTPPETASIFDDGLLTASEIAGLDLNSDWIVLSACNTAAPGQSVNSDGLAGLARAFFFAGARSLLVTHWPVETNSARLITESIFEDPEFALAHRSLALQRAQQKLIEAGDFSHPGFWGAFSVVGEGAQSPLQ